MSPVREAETAAKAEVEPWVVLYAVRYGLGRGSGAYIDSLRLVEEHAGLLERWQGPLVRDIKESITKPHPFRGHEELACAQRLLEALATRGWPV